MNSVVVSSLRCPICSGGLSEVVAGSGHALRCPRGHSFDISRQGYVNLQTGRAMHSGDTAAMVAARANFLAAGHYHFMAAGIRDAARASSAERAADHGPRLIADAGAGTGYYLGVVLDSFPDFQGLALDVSKPALRRAARSHPRAAAVLCDTWRQLPLVDHAVKLLLNVFAPRNAAEFARVLAPDGALIVVTPGAGHLAELVGALKLLTVPPEKEHAVARVLDSRFEQIASQALEQALHLTRDEIATVVAMGPSAWHVDSAELTQRIAVLPDAVTVTASVRIASYRPRAA
ncbi:MAG TPA: methyltransferase domain-containing protein [Bryobacteraceae bacterium]|nr:methyltransferase domain-containing protein [Bryobacteraceae bacterium]